MGLYDRLTFEHGIECPVPDLPVDLTAVTWQTKSIERPMLTSYRVSNDGRLLREDIECVTVPEEERPRYDEELGGFEHKFERCIGMIQTHHLGWTDTGYHGVVTCYRTVEDEHIRLEVTFTRGVLESMRRM